MTSAADRIFAVIQALAAAPEGRSLQAVAKAAGLAKPTAHKLLQDLEARSLARNVGDGSYALTLELAVIAADHLSRVGFLDICRPELDRLAGLSGELVRLAWRDGDRLVFVTEAQGAREGLRYDPNLGRPAILHTMAVGKCMLAWMTPEAAEAAVARQGLLGRQLGPNSITTMEALLTDLARVRKRGFATAIDETELGPSAVAAPIFAGEGSAEVVASLAVIGPSARFGMAEITRLAPEVMRSAADLTGRIGLLPFCRKGERDPRRLARIAAG